MFSSEVAGVPDVVATSPTGGRGELQERSGNRGKPPSEACLYTYKRIYIKQVKERLRNYVS